MSQPEALSKYEYRSVTRKLYLWAVAALLLSCLIIVRVRMVEVLEEETLLALGKLILACSVPLSVLVRLVLIVQPRIFSSYEVNGADIFRVRGRKRHQFSMENISKISISVFSPRFFGGFRIQMKSGQTLTFLSALKNSHQILEKVVAVRPDLLDSDRFHRYIEQSRRVDVSWRRLREKWLNWKMLATKYLFAPAVLTVVSVAVGNTLGSTYSWLDNIIYQWLLLSLLFITLGFIGNALEEKLALQKVQWNESKHQFERDLAFEKRTARLIDGLYLGMALGIGVLLVRGF